MGTFNRFTKLIATAEVMCLMGCSDLTGKGRADSFAPSPISNNPVLPLPSPIANRPTPTPAPTITPTATPSLTPSPTPDITLEANCTQSHFEVESDEDHFRLQVLESTIIQIPQSIEAERSSSGQTAEIEILLDENMRCRYSTRDQGPLAHLVSCAPFNHSNKKYSVTKSVVIHLGDNSRAALVRFHTFEKCQHANEDEN